MLFSVSTTFWKLLLHSQPSSHFEAEKSAFCEQIQSYKVRLKGSVGWLLFYIQLKIFTDESNSGVHKTDVHCGVAFVFHKN